MKKTLKYRCARRPLPRPSLIPQPIVQPEEPLGAGSGGGGGPGSRIPVGPDGNHAFYAGGHYEIIAPEVEIMAEATHPCVTIEAFYEMGGATGGRAFVNVHADKGIRMTSGTTPDVNAAETDGVDIVTEKDQEIMLERGLSGSNIQRINMTSSVILIDGNLGSVSITSMESIKLAVANGTSSIELTPEGIVLQGPLIKIN